MGFTYKKILVNEPEEPIFDKNGNKLDPHYMKVLSDIPGDELYDRNRRQLDGN
jgi:hypothetical protein